VLTILRAIFAIGKRLSRKRAFFFLSEEAQERGSIELSHKGLAH
jgi:hypothetical protein